MIPKIIHWCWIGPYKPPLFIRKCIKSWEKIMPDYKIILWDKNSFNFNSVPFVREAYVKKKWAFVSDYIRLYALYNFGGIYLDSDVTVFKSFDPLLKNNLFMGQDINHKGEVEGPETAIIGAEPHNKIIKSFLNYYETIHFSDDENMSQFLMPRVIGKLLIKYGYKFEDLNQILDENIIIYSTEYFTNKYSIKFRKKNYALHLGVYYWLKKETRIYEFFWRNRKLSLYDKLIKLNYKLWIYIIVKPKKIIKNFIS